MFFNMYMLSMRVYSMDHHLSTKKELSFKYFVRNGVKIMVTVRFLIGEVTTNKQDKKMR